MKRFRSLIAAILLAPLFAIGSLALAQAVIPQVVAINTSDLFQDVVRGSPQVGNYYATAAQIAGVPGYIFAGTALTGATTAAFTNSATDYFGVDTAATTLTITTAPIPSDGQRECVLISGTTAATITLSATTGQTVVGGSAITGSLTVPSCWTYVLANGTWYRSP